MTIIEYSLNSTPPTIPHYVADGGYWMNPDNEKMIGVGLDGSIPDNILTLTLEELQARQRSLHSKYPMQVYPEPDAPNMTDEEVNVAISNWVAERE
jgi:hypothetical protein